MQATFSNGFAFNFRMVVVLQVGSMDYNTEMGMIHSLLHNFDKWTSQVLFLVRNRLSSQNNVRYSFISLGSYTWTLISWTYPGHVTLFSQKFQDASRRFLYHFQATCIVGEGNMGKLDLLLAILKQEKKSIVFMFVYYPWYINTVVKIPRYA